ncbi:unnamed protein product [Lathyrus oleraceus]
MGMEVAHRKNSLIRKVEVERRRIEFLLSGLRAFG